VGTRAVLNTVNKYN